MHALTFKSSSSALWRPFSPQIYNFLQKHLFGLVFVCVSAALLRSELPAHSVVHHLSQITLCNLRGTICQLYAWVSNRIHHLLLSLDTGRQAERTYVCVCVCLCSSLKNQLQIRQNAFLAKQGHFLLFIICTYTVVWCLSCVVAVFSMNKPEGKFVFGKMKKTQISKSSLRDHKPQSSVLTFVFSFSYIEKLCFPRIKGWACCVGWFSNHSLVQQALMKWIFTALAACARCY